MEAIQSPLLGLVEAFGTRNQEQFLGDVVTPMWDAKSDTFINLQLVGADATSALTPAASVGQVGVNLETDTYITGLWFIEPQTTASDSVLILDTFVQRVGLTGAPVQIAPLTWRSFNTSGLLGRSVANRRMYPLEGWPWGCLLRAGDLISVRYENAGAAAFTVGMTIAYRGFKGPPA